MRRHRVLPGAAGRGGHGTRPAQRAARRSTRTTSRPSSFTLNTEGAPQVRQRHRREHRPPARDRPRRPRAVGADASRGASPTDGRITGSFTQEEVAEPVADPAVGRAAGVADLPRGADDRPDASAPTRSAPASSPRSSACCSSSCFMLVYYKLSGVNAVVALVFNLVILLGLMAYIGAVMTLPGIAGFVLTMGMGVDSNVLIFERIKEELEAQRGVRAVDQRRLQPRLPDAGRHARGGAHLGGVPLPVRHRADPRLRGDAVRRPAVEPVHLDLRVEDAVRAGAARRRQQVATLSASEPCISSRTPTSISSAGAGTPRAVLASSSSPASS